MNEKDLQKLLDFVLENKRDAKLDGNNDVAEMYAQLEGLINEAFIELN